MSNKCSRRCIGRSSRGEARRLVRLNIGAALALKMLLAVGAVGGVVSLLVAVLVGDMGASIFVTLNAMRLAHVTPAANR